MAKIFSSADQMIGRTPLLELVNLEKTLGLDARILAKLEYFNPAGSTKDRAAKFMVDDAERDGILSPGATIIEPTSGNTGIGLCMIAASRGYKCVIIMPDTMSVERIKIMKAYGAEVVLTDGKLGMSGAIAEAEKIKEKIPGSWIAGQFVNRSNARAHYETTGPEIFEDTDGRVDIFVAGVGTGGTVTGIGKYLKSRLQDVKIIAVEPDTSAVLSGEAAGAHKLQGIGAGFVPEVLDTGVYDEIIKVSGEDAYKYARMMGTIQGVLVGISSGAALSAAVELAKKPENKGKNIVVLMPDSGDRYLSTDLYE